ncbi:cofactor assembly of complex C subunit B [Merismopedia glauca]|uniref:Cofactor assembly of complex C subunit B n=1 Tax=Merismopedia glauca CCAP 1448/3 TaxID=1296344 RepID=A0A2T1C642_9CYAN|nr:cofactor assembly of complex C subunit B [Merismopedia glauca]PSB03704.1 cofactor assembly of complex C subunit B [Merismopedia glauca CCAP 1448/3]
MDTTVLSSTFLLTILSAIGLVFFIRASVKERSTQLQLIAERSEDLLLPELEQYFLTRAYGLDTVDPSSQLVTFKGFVRPSWFLAIFLTTLAACGLVCLGLILGFLYPPVGNRFLLLILLAPLAAIFYWSRAGRIEYVSLKVEKLASTAEKSQTLITVTGHRDELRILQQSLQLRSVN